MLGWHSGQGHSWGSRPIRRWLPHCAYRYFAPTYLIVDDSGHDTSYKRIPNSLRVRLRPIRTPTLVVTAHSRFTSLPVVCLHVFRCSRLLHLLLASFHYNTHSHRPNHPPFKPSKPSAVYSIGARKHQTWNLHFQARIHPTSTSETHIPCPQLLCQIISTRPTPNTSRSSSLEFTATQRSPTRRPTISTRTGCPASVRRT